MTDKEFKKLNRAQLIDIIYQLQLRQEELTAENKDLQEKLADKRLRVDNAGNIARAALEINDVMDAAQKAAEQYLEEIRARRSETEEECRRIIEEAHRKAQEIISGVQPASADADNAQE